MRNKLLLWLCVCFTLGLLSGVAQAAGFNVIDILWWIRR